MNTSAPWLVLRRGLVRLNQTPRHIIFLHQPGGMVKTKVRRQAVHQPGGMVKTKVRDLAVHQPGGMVKTKVRGQAVHQPGGMVKTKVRRQAVHQPGGMVKIKVTALLLLILLALIIPYLSVRSRLPATRALLTRS